MEVMANFFFLNTQVENEVNDYYSHGPAMISLFLAGEFESLNSTESRLRGLTEAVIKIGAKKGARFR